MSDYRLPHSAEVAAWLDVHGHGRIQLGWVSPKTVEACEPVTLPACWGWLVMLVDGNELRSRVKVGAVTNERTVRCE